MIPLLLAALLVCTAWFVLLVLLAPGDPPWSRSYPCRSCAGAGCGECRPGTLDVDELEERGA